MRLKPHCLHIKGHENSDGRNCAQKFFVLTDCFKFVWNACPPVRSSIWKPLIELAQFVGRKESIPIHYNRLVNLFTERDECFEGALAWDYTKKKYLKCRTVDRILLNYQEYSVLDYVVSRSTIPCQVCGFSKVDASAEERYKEKKRDCLKFGIQTSKVWYFPLKIVLCKDCDWLALSTRCNSVVDLQIYILGRIIMESVEAGESCELSLYKKFVEQHCERYDPVRYQRMIGLHVEVPKKRKQRSKKQQAKRRGSKG